MFWITRTDFIVCSIICKLKGGYIQNDNYIKKKV